MSHQYLKYRLLVAGTRHHDEKTSLESRTHIIFAPTQQAAEREAKRIAEDYWPSEEGWMQLVDLCPAKEVEVI